MSDNTGFILMTRPHLGKYFDRIREDGMNPVEGLTTPFETKEDAMQWIINNGYIKNEYEIRDYKTKFIIYGKYVFGTKWYLTR